MNGTQSENVADESSTRGEENKRWLAKVLADNNNLATNLLPSTKDTEQQKKKKKMKNIGLFGLVSRITSTNYSKGIVPGKTELG